jgi:hypothetical protein
MYLFTYYTYCACLFTVFNYYSYLLYLLTVLNYLMYLFYLLYLLNVLNLLTYCTYVPNVLYLLYLRIVLTYLFTYSLQAAESLRRRQVCSQSRNSPHFTEPEDSLPHSQVPATIWNRSASTNCATRVPRSQ